MSRRFLSAACLLTFFAIPVQAQGPHGGGRSYPRVIGPTGRPYGPTQAHYQYQRRYGRPAPGAGADGGIQFVNGFPGGGHGGHGWHGGFGRRGGFGTGIFLDATPFLYPPMQGYTYIPSTAYYGYSFQSVPFGPTLHQPILSTVPFPSMEPLPGLTPAPDVAPLPAAPQGGAIMVPSTRTAKEKSLRFQSEGDQLLQELSILAASERYRRSIDAARDRAEPRYRLALTLASRSRFLEAVDQFRLSVELDPTWPQKGVRLDDLLGTINHFEKMRIKQRVAEWTAQDARDPNRLFLLGVMLHMDGDERCKQMIETAIALSGPEPHLMAFLSAPVPLGAAGATVIPGKEIPPVPPEPTLGPDDDFGVNPSEEEQEIPVPPLPDEFVTPPALPELPIPAATPDLMP